MNQRTASRIGWGLVGLSMALYGTTVALGVTRRPVAAVGESTTAAQDLVFLAAFVVCAATGGAIVSRQPGNRIGWLFLGIGVTSSFNGFAFEYVVRGMFVAPGSLPLVREVAWVTAWLWISTVVFLNLILLLFPDGRFRWRLSRLFGWVTGLAGAGVVAAAVMFWDERGLDMLTGDDPPTGPAGALLEGAIMTLFALILVSVVMAIARFVRSKGEERLQLKWFAFAVALIGIDFLLSELDLIPAGLLPFFDLVAIVSLPVSVGIAVLKYRLYDIDVVINKTLVYGALAAFITLVYVGVVVGIGALVGSGEEPNLALQVAATALVAFLFQPVRERTQRLANALVYGKRATPYEVVSTLATRLSEVPAVEDVLPRMAETAARGVGAERAMVRLYLPTGDAQTVVWPPDARVEPWDATLDVTHAGGRIGQIAVAKARGDALRPNELALLEDLAGQAGLALHNVRLTAELRARLVEIGRQADEIKESRARLVAARDEERRRLEGEISSGVQRRLAAIDADLGAAAELVPVDGERAALSLDRIASEVTGTLEQLRDLARGVFPPLLGDKGVVAALEAHVSKLGFGVDVDVDPALRSERFDEEIEAAVYFCLVEALRHAGTSAEPRVELRLRDGELAFVTDGIAATADGVQRMRDRVEALGGGLEIFDAGIRARVPARTLERA